MPSLELRLNRDYIVPWDCKISSYMVTFINREPREVKLVIGDSRYKLTKGFNIGRGSIPRFEPDYPGIYVSISLEQIK